MDSRIKNDIEIVDKIISKKAAGKDTQALEKQLDEMIYKLYDLNEDEIKLIEKS